MVRLREYLDADRRNQFNPSLYKTDKNTNRVYCGMCGGIYFVDDAVYNAIIKAIKETTESPFLCQDCQDEYDALARRY
jgi:uncharacterized protein YlaI